MHQKMSAGGASFHSAHSIEVRNASWQFGHLRGNKAQFLVCARIQGVSKISCITSTLLISLKTPLAAHDLLLPPPGSTQLQEELDTCAANKGTQDINWCDNSCYSSAAPTPRTGPDSPRTAAAAAAAQHASRIPALPVAALGLQLSSELKPFAQCLSPTEGAAEASAAGRKQPKELLPSPGRRSPSKPTVLPSEGETSAALRGLISPQNSHPPPGHQNQTTACFEPSKSSLGRSSSSSTSRRSSTNNSCSISIGRSTWSSYRSASSSTSTDASPICRSAVAAHLGIPSSPRYGKSTSSSRARTALTGSKASEGKLPERTASLGNSRRLSVGSIYDTCQHSPSGYALLSPGRTARATTTTTAAANAQVRSVYSSISEASPAQTRFAAVPSVSHSTAATGTRQQSAASAAMHRASADAGVVTAAPPKGMRSSLTRSTGGVTTAAPRLSGSIGSFSGRVWKDPGSCNGASAGHIVSLPSTSGSISGRKTLASSNGGISSSGRSAGAVRTQGYAAVAEQRRSLAAAGSKVATITRTRSAAPEAETAVAVAAAVPQAPAAPTGGDLMGALAAVAAMASAMAAVSAAAAAAAAVREFDVQDAQTAATAQVSEVTKSTEATAEITEGRMSLSEAATAQGPTERATQAAQLPEITAATAADCRTQEEQATAAAAAAPEAGSERLQIIDESAAAAAAAAAAKAAAASGYVSPRNAEKSVVMELEPSALPFLISKAILRRPVELIITEDAVYCAANPQLLSKAPSAGSRSTRSKPTRSIKSLLKTSQHSLAAAALPKPLQQVCAAAAEVPGCTGSLFNRSLSVLSGLHTVERLETAYEALRVVSTEYAERAGGALKVAAAVQRTEAAARFEAAHQALKAHSLLARGRAVELYRHSAAMIVALDAAGRFSAAAEQLKQLTSEGACRARQLFKHAAAFIIAKQAAKRFVAAFEALKAALPAGIGEGTSSSSSPRMTSPAAVLRMQSARASAWALWSKAASSSSKQLSAGAKVLTQRASAAGHKLLKRSSKLSKSTKKKLVQGARMLSKGAAKRLSKLQHTERSRQTGSSSSPRQMALQAALDSSTEAEAAAEVVCAAEGLQSLAAAVDAAGSIQEKVAAAETAAGSGDGIKAGC